MNPDNIESKKFTISDNFTSVKCKQTQQEASIWAFGEIMQ